MAAAMGREGYDEDQRCRQIPGVELRFEHGFSGALGDERIPPEVTEAAVAPGAADDRVEPARDAIDPDFVICARCDLIGAEGGTFGTARGYASLAGARGRFDYNLFGEQFNTSGQGINDQYSSSLEGANIGVQIAPRAAFRLRTRHFTDRSGVQGFWNFNGQPLVPPDSDARARQNNFLASAELTISGPSRWEHRFSGFEYHHRRSNVDTFMDPGRVSPAFGNFDFPFSDFANLNRAGFDYQGDYVARSWAHTTVGYGFEDENGTTGSLPDSLSHGLRRERQASDRGKA